MLTSFGLMLSMGFVGSLHCIGMCGGLVSALSLSRPRIWWGGLLGYQAGRVATYALLGLGAGLLGGALSGIELAPRVLAGLAGLVMIAFGLNLAGMAPDPLTRITDRVRRRIGLARLTQLATGQPSLWSWYSMGLANGLLPCGLVYAALSLALAGGGVIQGTTMMAAFGLGTVPAMLLAPAALRGLTPELRGRGMRVAGLLMVLLGVWTMARGAILPMGHMG